MKIFALTRPHSSEFALAFQPGGLGVPLAPSPIPPGRMVLEWEAGSDAIGDFTWVSGRIAVTERVRQALSSRFSGFAFFPVELHQDPKLRKPSRSTKRTARRVWLPYDGPPLHELWVIHWAHADLDRSSLRLLGEDAETGKPRYAIEGVESDEWEWDTAQLEMRWWRVPRYPGKGVFVHRDVLMSADVFRIHERPGWVLCTEQVKAFIEKEKFTNVDFLDVGDIV